MYENKSDHNVIIIAKEWNSFDEYIISTFLEQKVIDRLVKKLNEGDYSWEDWQIPRKFINDFGDPLTQEEIDMIKEQEAYLLGENVDFSMFKLKLIIDVFPFHLYKRNLSKIDKAKQELILLKNMKTSIDKELTLFNTYFFNNWDETAKKAIQKKRSGMYDKTFSLPFHSSEDLYYVMNVPVYVRDDVNTKKKGLKHEESKAVKSVFGHDKFNLTPEAKSLSGEDSNSEPDIEESKIIKPKEDSMFHLKDENCEKKCYIGLPESFHKELLKIHCSRNDHHAPIIVSTTDLQTLEPIHKLISLNKEIVSKVMWKDSMLNLYEIDWNLNQNSAYKVYIPKILL